MKANQSPMLPALVTLNPQLELVSYTEKTSLWCPLSARDAVGLAREIARFTAALEPAKGMPQAVDVNHALLQAAGWLEKAHELLATAAALTPPTSTLAN